MLRLPAELACDRNSRIPVCLRNADLLSLSGCQAFGAAHVWSSAEQIGRDADHDVRRRNRNISFWTAGEQIGEIDCGHAEQNAELILGNSLIDQKLVPLRAALFQIALGL